VPIVPFIVAAGRAAVVASLVLSAVALFAIGAAITIFTGVPVLRSGGRQLVLGLGAAGLTFTIGRLIGVVVS
jgi:VIT1/CCC1 family predicted Fe2+/Mn2+ transporter